MNKYDVYVEEQLIDIDPSQVIAVTYQASDIGSGDIINRKSSFTNQLKAPKTNNNIAVFQWANFIKSGSTFPFLKKSVKINCNGIQILTGIVLIKSTNEFFNLQIYSSPKDLQLAIGAKMLDELDFGDSPITWDQLYMNSVRASTTGLCSPVINYGQIDFSAANGSIGDYNLPSVGYKSILTQILLEAGYTVSGTFYTSDPDFNNMVMSYGRSSWPGTSFKINEILPDDILQYDFLRDFLVKFGAFFRIVGSNVEIITIKEILDNKVSNAIDWTLKRANKKQTLSFGWDGWDQMNNFLYERDSPTLNPISFYSSDGSIDSTNENAQPSRDVYKSLFNPTSPARNLLDVASYQIAGGFVDVYCATQEIYETLPSSFVFDNTPKPMLLILRNRVAADGATIRYNGVPRADMKIAYFKHSWGGAAVNDLRWKNSDSKGLLDIHYSEFEDVLNNVPKSAQNEYLLNEIDMNQLDVLTPVFDDGDIFLINKVNTFVPGRLTRVALLKI